jgi:hydrogenase maturation protease
MGVSIENDPGVRVLGLGNEILADDAFGIVVAREVKRRFGHLADCVESCEAGFNLLDRLLGVSRLLVVDTIVTGTAKPGTLHICRADNFPSAANLSPHFLGIFDVLAVAGKLGLPVPREVTILAVEAADCFTVGGAMHPDVCAAVAGAMDLVADFLKDGSCTIPGHSG